MRQNKTAYSQEKDTMDYTFAMVLFGICVFIYMLSANTTLWWFGFSIRPLIETSHNIVLYFLISPFFILVAYRTNVTENKSYLLLYLCLIFFPVMFISSVIYYYLMGNEFVYFNDQHSSINIVETFAVKIFKALPIVAIAPSCWIILSRWSAKKRIHIKQQLIALQPTRTNKWQNTTAKNIITKEEDTKYPEQVRNLLVERWREMLWQRTAIYGTLPFTLLLLLHTGNENFDRIILWSITSSIVGAAVYHMTVVFIERTFPQRRLTDLFIIVLEALPVLIWTAQLLLIMTILGNNPDRTSIFMLITAIWGGAITITAGITSTRFMAAYLPRLLSLIIFAIAIYFYVPDPAWSLAVLTAIIFTVLATIISYFSYIHHLQQIAANLERDEAVRIAEQEYKNRQDLVGKIGHDLKNIHYSIHLLAGRLESRYENLSEEIGIVREGIQYANDLFADIQNAHYLGKPAPEREPVILGELLSFVARTFSEQAKLKGIEIKHSYTGLSINSDVSMLERILRNILSNAIKHAQCTKIILGIKRRSNAGNHFYDLCIIDNGNSGDFLSDSKIRKKNNIYENNASNLRSLSLGLRIIEELSDALGYTYFTFQKKGKGTAFIIRIPSQDIL